jgi:hypothetical protein
MQSVTLSVLHESVIHTYIHTYVDSSDFGINNGICKSQKRHRLTQCHFIQSATSQLLCDELLRSTCVGYFSVIKTQRLRSDSKQNIKAVRSICSTNTCSRFTTAELPPVHPLILLRFSGVRTRHSPPFSFPKPTHTSVSVTSVKAYVRASSTLLS